MQTKGKKTSKLKKNRNAWRKIVWIQKWFVSSNQNKIKLNETNCSNLHLDTDRSNLG